MAVVVSGFPCIGKTTACKKFREINICALDSDSSHWSWVTKEDGTKERNPEFPGNYIKHLKECIDSGTYDVIFVSTHEAVREAMRENGIKYTLVYPSTSMLLTEYIGRAYTRGSGTAFCDTMIKFWDSWIDSCNSDPTDSKIVLGASRSYVYEALLDTGLATKIALNNL